MVMRRKSENLERVRPLEQDLIERLNIKAKQQAELGSLASRCKDLVQYKSIKKGATLEPRRSGTEHIRTPIEPM